MTLQNAIEIVQNEHSDVPVGIIAQYVKSGYREFASQSKFIRSTTQAPTLTPITDTNVGAWTLKYQIASSDLASATFEPLGLRNVYYDGTGLYDLYDNQGSFVRYRWLHQNPAIDIVTQPFVGELDANLFAIESFGFNPQIIDSTSYVEDFGLGNLEFDMYGVNAAMKAFYLRKNLTVQASYYEREMRRILNLARKEISHKSDGAKSIQVTL